MYGFSAQQAYIYLTTYTKDPWVIRAMVSVLVSKSAKLIIQTFWTPFVISNNSWQSLENGEHKRWRHQNEATNAGYRGSVALYTAPSLEKFSATHWMKYQMRSLKTGFKQTDIPILNSQSASTKSKKLYRGAELLKTSSWRWYKTRRRSFTVITA
ncbi:hypothetical protein PUNSTDRAFT_46241 [Punctularia strigosozonata HHB-11173 SS5]|uniref:uncharacterized protein n=1 Tax=Punctularia strigosozonata (strain HHB-11173) TaxID=741275 RepID=UPI0004416970|nr:uncharacterized protein PUNSTDRAFT_46241 [Punctularia strigosozonata HHB-11173 SS5]EIN06897.1 hypothetical protein PUNSTDRAFT_46241 [Punctularia strigosozonata HHB-11173 SS5]